MKYEPSIEFLAWYQQATLTKIPVLDLWAAWCAGRAALYREVEEFEQIENGSTPEPSRIQ